jgi:hypothetical protein
MRPCRRKLRFALDRVSGFVTFAIHAKSKNDSNRLPSR